MWRNNLAYAATVLAVANGIIAIGIALLPNRRSVHKLRLGALALVLGAVAVGTTFYAKHHARAQIERANADRAEIRTRLEAFAEEGRGLLAHIKDGRRDLPARDADEWAQRAEVFLTDKLGERYVPRFRKETDMYGDDTAIAAPRLPYWRAVRNRVVALDGIAAEFQDRPWRRP